MHHDQHVLSVLVQDNRTDRSIAVFYNTTDFFLQFHTNTRVNRTILWVPITRSRTFNLIFYRNMIKVFGVLIPVVILSFSSRLGDKVLQIPKIFVPQDIYLSQTFHYSPGSSSLVISPASSVAVLSFVLPCSTSLPTGSNSPSNDSFGFLL